MSKQTNNEEYIFTYDRDEIREIYEKMLKGITIPMNKALKEDIKQYVKLLNTISEDDDDDELAGLTKEERINHIMERHKREATKSDVILLELSDKQKAEIRKGMETSIVRPNPRMQYHKLDEELYDTAEKKEIYTALSRVDKCYYNQHDYVNAINTIIKAIKYSLEHDYPWLSKDEAYDAFNKGEIKFTYKQIPVLYTGWNKIIEDPKILAGIVTGRIDIIDEKSKKTRKKKEFVIPEGVSNYEHDNIKIDTVGVNEYNRQYQMHQHGIDNPLSTVIRAEIGTYSRFSLPTNNYFYKSQEQINRQPLVFDWLQDDAGEKYYDIINNTKKDTISDIIDCVYEANDGNIKTNMQGDMESFLNHLRHPEKTNQHLLYESSLVQSVDPNTVALEQSILQQMRNANPNI